jgi:uncharacterized protein YlaI
MDICFKCKQKKAITINFFLCGECDDKLKQQLKNAGYELEVSPFNGGMMLYIPV